MTAEEQVKQVFPDAAVYGYGHGKVRIETPTKIISEMIYTGTREQRRERAWESALNGIRHPFAKGQ